MRACCIVLLLIVTLEQSCCNEEEIPQGDYGLSNLNYKKIIANVANDKDCYERREKTTPLKYHEELYTIQYTLRTETPVEYIIVRVSKENCTSEKECLKIIHSMRKQVLRKGCDLVDNFYVGNDGFVHEGRGWDIAPYWNLNGLRLKAITVNFFGNYTKNIPPPQVVEAFQTTLQLGVWLGKVSKNYKVTSMRQLFNEGGYVGEKLDKYLMTWESWINATYITSLWEYTIPKRLTFVFRSQWNASKPLKELIPITHPASNILISEGGERCLNRFECTSWLKAEQTERKTNYGDLLHNFYIGEEGEVYEGRGWDVTPHWEFPGIKNGILSIALIGSFELNLPSESAINSLKLLIHTGVWLGKISSGFQLFSLRQVYRERSLMGETLYKKAEGWVPRWKYGDLIPRNEIGKSQPLPSISASDWGADFPAWGATGITVAVDYVIVYDGAGRCFTRRECTTWMKKEEQDYRSHYGNLLDNFYIGEDGGIYEGRGWRRIPQWSTLFPGISFITVKFMGSFEQDAPEWLALTAFKTLLKTGIDSGMISPNHRLITLRQTYTDANSLSNGLEGCMREMKSWTNRITVGINGFTPLYRNLIFPRDRWASWPHLDYPKLRHPVDYVVVGSVGRGCFTQNTCINTIKNWFHRINYSRSIMDNFYVGEDGWAYEGRGWDGASPLNLKEDDHSFLFVKFLGSFESAPPSPIAMYAFQHLMEFGVGTGKLSPQYKIVSIRQIFQDAKIPVDMLSEGIKSWDRWSENVPYSSGKAQSPSGNSIYISRRNWNAASWTPFPDLDHWIRRVYVGSVGSRCFSREECTSVVRAEQSKSSSLVPPDCFVMENFYVGEDGHVYEGRGWDAPPPWEWAAGHGRDLITVAFLGNFEEDLPSPEAVFAFRYLIRLGMSLDRISSSYRLESLRTSCANESSSLGGALDREIKSWEMWSPTSLITCPSDSLPSP